jgi:hypothetical protein
VYLRLGVELVPERYESSYRRVDIGFFVEAAAPPFLRYIE